MSNNVVVRLDDDLVGTMVEADRPCERCGESYSIIREGRGRKLEARCQGCNALIQVLDRRDSFGLVRDLRAARRHVHAGNGGGAAA